MMNDDKVTNEEAIMADNMKYNIKILFLVKTNGRIL